MQDLDKLKFLILTGPQRYFFDLIPQPEIIDGNPLFLTKKSLNSKNGLKNIDKNDVAENYENLKQNFSELDDKLISLLDPELLKSIKITSPFSKLKSNFFCFLLLIESRW